MNRNQVRAASILPLLLILASIGLLHSPRSDAQVVYGVVRVYNPNPIPAQVYTQNLNAFGAPQWVPIANVAPNSFIDLPRVPNGQQFGVQLANGFNFPPFTAFFRNPYQAYFEYVAR
jgi:hypothetical protein